MRFFADLHIHSKYSRATSKNLDLENLAYWGRKKGITVIGTGDFTHPAWMKEIKEKLVPAEPGLFQLRPDLEKKITELLPAACQGKTRFMLSVEISTIYKKGDKVRKIHHLVYAPTIEQAERINRRLEKIGNIRSDGRPILGLDSRNLLEIVLEAGKDCYIVPAHIWTPWFAVLGSKSGFNKISDCYGDLADHVFAAETGLSSDPEMNWQISDLDKYCMVSNSDAHSPGKLGREASLFETELNYFEMKRALETREGFAGTVEFFPEEGKYHLDGHRKCNIRFTPEESKAHDHICPACNRPLTLGVSYRVHELSDRKKPEKPKNAADFQSFIPLPEMISETVGVGPASKRVAKDYETVLNKLGSELHILGETPIADIQKNSNSLIAEAIDRMRKGEVIRDAGFDGEYGTIKLFKPGELDLKNSTGVLFDVPIPDAVREGGVKKNSHQDLTPPSRTVSGAHAKKKKDVTLPARTGSGVTAFLDGAQQKAVDAIEGPVLIIAGPGSGKTRTLTYRIAHIIEWGEAKPEECLTLTFTKRAANEMKERLQTILGEKAAKIPVFTFHALGLEILKEHRVEMGLPRNFQLAGDELRQLFLIDEMKVSPSKAKTLVKSISLLKRMGQSTDIADVIRAKALLDMQRDKEGWVDYDDLILLPVKLFKEHAGMASYYGRRYKWFSIDEYQDIDDLQYQLIKLLVPEDGNICAIGDPDQAIYSFRGANVKFFMNFEEDFKNTKKFTLYRNYRSGQAILSASTQMIEPATLVEGRHAETTIEEEGSIVIHHAASDKAEAEYVVEKIEKIMGGISFFSMDSERSEGDTEHAYSFSDFAVLYRTDTQGKLIEEALERSGIPYERFGQKSLYENKIIQRILEIVEASGHESLRAKLGEAFEILAREDLPGFEEQFKRLDPIAEKSGDDLHFFISKVQLTEETDLWDPRADRVSLLTLHASKGLEFPVVFIVGCEEGILPMKFAENISGEELAEERRLFFVGMTRAKHKLYLSHAARRVWRGKPIEPVPSLFLKDIEERLYEIHQNKPRTKKVEPIKTAQLDLF